MAFKPTIAQMIKVLKFELMDKESDQTGGRLEKGKEWFTTRGYFRELSSYRKFNSGYDETVVVAEIFIHWRQAVENDMSKDVQIVYDNRFFGVDSFKRHDEDRRLFVITIKESR